MVASRIAQIGLENQDENVKKKKGASKRVLR